MCMYVCMFVYVCVRVCLWRSTLGVFLDRSPPYVLGQGFPLNLEFTNLARLAGQKLLISLHHHSTGYRCCCCCPTGNVGSWDLNSGPYVCAARTLLSRLPSLIIQFFFSFEE